jgi:hypothetical protein
VTRLLSAALLAAILLVVFAARSEAGRYSRVHRAVCAVFGRYCEQAMRVIRCETGGTYSVRARNGQYLGLFQMGASERARYGHGRTARLQARAAFRYFVASGRDWSPWSCRP